MIGFSKIESSCPYTIFSSCLICLIFFFVFSDKSVDVQYITTSVEILILDQAEHLLMQNWATVQEVVGQLNQRPIKPSLSSPARIRLAYLAGYGSRYRQTLLFSAVNNYLISALISKCESKLLLNFLFEFLFIYDNRISSSQISKV